MHPAHGLYISLLILCLLAWPPVQANDAIANPPADWIEHGLQAIPLPKFDNLDAEIQVRLVEGRERVNAVLQDKPTAQELAVAYGELGALYQIYFLPRAADQCYANAMVLDPGNFRWAYLSAYLAAETGRMALAVQRYQHARSLKPGYKALDVRLADAYLELNELDTARTTYESVVDEAGLEAAARFGLGQIALLQRDFDMAITRFNRVLELDPAANRVHFSLAQALRALRRNDEARVHLDLRGDDLPAVKDPHIEGLMALKNETRVHFLHAMNAINRQDYTEARDFFARGLEKEPENAVALVSYARTLYLTGAAAESRSALERAVSLQPDNTLGLFLLGIVVEEGGDSARAQEYYRRVLQHEPTHAGAHYYLGNLLFRQQEAGQAASHYRQSLAADARYSAAYIPYLGVLFQTGAPDITLLETLRDAAHYFPEQPVFSGLLARLLASSDDPQIRDSQQALKLAEQLAGEQRIPPHLEVLALAQAANNRFEEAAANQEEALMLVAWSMPGEAARLDDILAAYRAEKMPPTDWPVIQPPVLDGQGPFRNYPAPRPY